MCKTKNSFLLRKNCNLHYENNRTMSNALPIKPTEGELEILSLLWKHGRASVRTIHEEINKTRESGYTTTLKLMQIMHEKGLLLRDDSSKVHIYFPAIAKEKTQKMLLGKFIHNLYEGSAASLVMQALGTAKPKKDELEKIEALIAELKKK